jgi:hypothetical protein
MNNLVLLLTKETQELKSQYLEKTKNWAINFYNLCIERNNWQEDDWCKYFGIDYTLSKFNQRIFPKGFYNTKNSMILNKMRNEIFSICNLGLEKYLKKEELAAILHYESSIEKLAFRIIKKGLNIKNIKIKNNSIGVNINSEITDGLITVNAWTIIAEGQIQKPHYRYLIK